MIAHAQQTSRTALETSNSEPAVSAAVILPGRFESCAINPPLSLITAGYKTAKKDGEYVVTERQSAPATAVLVAYSSPDKVTKEPTAFVVDELTVSAAGTRSKTGQAAKVYQAKTSLAETHLVPKSGDYSVCRFSGSVSPQAKSIAQSNFSLERARFDVTAVSASLWNIFGPDALPSIRLRLSSTPTGADILIGELRQQAHTDTILDVLRGDIPKIRLEKSGFEPCSYRQWKTSFEKGSKPILNASCRLQPKKAPGRKR
jgi:hypothetical protein